MECYNNSMHNPTMKDVRRGIMRITLCSVHLQIIMVSSVYITGCGSLWSRIVNLELNVKR